MTDAGLASRLSVVSRRAISAAATAAADTNHGRQNWATAIFSYVVEIFEPDQYRVTELLHQVASMTLARPDAIHPSN